MQPSPKVAPDAGLPPSRAIFVGGLTLAIAGAVLFSTKAIVAKLLYRYQLDAITVVGFRMLFSLPVFGAVGWWQMRRGAPLATADRWRLVGLGLVGYYLSSFLDFLGLQYITVGLERLLLFLTPTFVLLITVVVLKQRIASRQWLALLVSYGGIVLVFLHDLHNGGEQVVLGAALVLASAASYAVYLLGCGELVKRIGAPRLVAYAMCVSSVACIGQFIALRPTALLTQPVEVYGLSLLNAILCTVLPVFMTMTAVQRIGAPVASQAGMIGPVSTLFLGALLLGEPITAIQLAGTALVLSGIYLLSRR